MTFKLLIDGQMVAGDYTTPVLNPATEVVLAECPISVVVSLLRATLGSILNRPDNAEVMGAGYVALSTKGADINAVVRVHSRNEWDAVAA